MIFDKSVYNDLYIEDCEVCCNPIEINYSSDGNEITGFCFTPQDGNSILSSISATEWFLYPHSYEDKIQCLSNLFFNNI